MARKEESDPVVAALTELQCLIREDRPVTPEESVITISIPDDLARPDAKTLLLGVQEAEALQSTKVTIERDLRFEHLGGQTADPLQQKLIRFASLCAIEPEQDQVAAFVAENEQTPEERVCFLGVEFLNVKQPFDLFGLRLLPTAHNDIPDSISWFSVEPPVGSVIVVPVSGTQLALMKDRAAAVANRVLRVLRVGLRENPYLNQLQFRFRLSDSYSSADTSQAGRRARMPGGRWTSTRSCLRWSAPKRSACSPESRAMTLSDTPRGHCLGLRTR
jgi:hypothetical protein